MMIEERDLKSVCRTMIILRMICVGVALSVMAFLIGAGLNVGEGFPIAGLLLVVFPLSAIWWLMLKSGYAVQPLLYSQLIADLAVEGGVVYFTGGAQSHFTVLFLISIFIAGIVLYTKGAIIAATVSSALFAGASLLETSHFHGLLGIPAGRNSGVLVVLNVAVEVVFFYLVAILAGHVARRIKVFGARLRITTSELERARMDTRQIIESMHSGLVTVDSDGIITEFNRSASRILATQPDEARGRNVKDVIGTVSPELSQKIIDAVENGTPEERGEVIATTADGQRIPLGVSISPLSGSETDSSGVVVVFQDLTEVKTMAHRVRLADRLAALGELSAAIAHEIRTPLASICGSIEMLRDSLAPEGENGTIVDLIIKESERLRKKIDYFLQFAGSRPARFNEVCLNSVLAEVVCLVRNHPHFSDQTAIDLDAKANVVTSVDEETIKQVFYNLAINAVEALESRGKVSITLDVEASPKSKGYVRVSFEDDGVGIDEDDLGRVFEPFYTNKETGTGLGLAIAAKIVEDHGGKLEIKSARGKGTVATVYLPLDRVITEDGYSGAGSSKRLAETSKTRVE